MKNRLILAAALLLLLLFAVGCTGTRGNDPLASVAETGTDTEVGTGTGTGTETENGYDTLAETGPADPGTPTETESEAPATPVDTEPETEAPVPVLGERIDRRRRQGDAEADRPGQGGRACGHGQSDTGRRGWRHRPAEL